MKNQPPYLHELPLRKLRRMLRDTVALAGPESMAVRLIRRAIEKKRRGRHDD